MDFRETRICKIISAVVLFFFAWSFADGHNIAHAAWKPEILKSPRQSVAPYIKEKGSAHKFTEAVEDIRKTLKDAKLSQKDKKSRVKGLMGKVVALDAEIRAQFEATGKHLREKGLSRKLIKRHKEFVDSYKSNFKTLRKNAKAVSRAKKSEFKGASDKALKHLDKVKPTDRYLPQDMNKLPRRTPEPTTKKPREIKDSYIDLRAATHEDRPFVSAPLLLASTGNVDGIISEQVDYIQLAMVEGGPIEADLSENVEVKFTNSITAKAAELGHNPIKIYEWVRNNVEYAPTFGSIQGADYCMQTMQCNAIDSASLLIALLRASGIPARYAHGTIEMPIERFSNWAGGFTNSQSALDFSATGGIPTKGLTKGGKIAYAQLEHVWVEAWVDMMPSLGAIMGSGGKMWVPLDGSYKQYAYTEGMDISSAVPFDAEALVNDIVDSAIINETEGWVTGVDSEIINTAMTGYRAQVEEYFTTQHPDATVGDVLGTKTIIAENHPILIGTLPYKMREIGTRMSTIPDELRHKVRFTVRPDEMNYDAAHIEHSIGLPELAGKKVTLSYSPATAEDEDIINSYLPEPHPDGTPIDPSEFPDELPAYLINMNSELRVEGEVVATGGPYQLGTKQTFHMHFDGPALDPGVVNNCIYAGEYYGIAIDVARISKGMMEKVKARLENTKAKLEAEDYEGLTKDDLLGDLLYTTAMTYYAEYDVMDEIQANSIGVNNIRVPSQSIFKTTVDTYEMFGTPVSVSAGGLKMDVDRNLTLTKATDGDREKYLQFMRSSGMNSSALEHSVPEQLFSTPETLAYGISAARALEVAAIQGIPIYTINRENAETVIPQLQLDVATIQEIRNAVNAGNEVTTSQVNINFYGWQGCGYVIKNPITGTGGYMITGQENGTDLIPINNEYLNAISNLFSFLEIKGTLLAALIGSALLSTAAQSIGLFLLAMSFLMDANRILGTYKDNTRKKVGMVFSSLFTHAVPALAGNLALTKGATSLGPLGTEATKAITLTIMAQLLNIIDGLAFEMIDELA